MNTLTVKTNEIRCMQAAYLREIRIARKMNHELVRMAILDGSTCGNDHRRSVRRELRDEAIHAARVLRDILKELEG